MMPTPCAARLRMISNSAFTSRSEMEEVGSSMTSMRQLKEMALTISTICCWAMLRSAIRESASMPRSKRSSIFWASALILDLLTPKEPMGSRPRKMFSATVMYGTSTSS